MEAILDPEFADEDAEKKPDEAADKESVTTEEEDVEKHDDDYPLDDEVVPKKIDIDSLLGDDEPEEEVAAAIPVE